MVFPEAALQLAHKHRLGKKFRFSQQADRRHNRNTALPQAIHKGFCRRAGRHDVLDNDDVRFMGKAAFWLQFIASRHERTLNHGNVFHRLHIIGIGNFFPNDDVPCSQILFETFRQSDRELISSAGGRNRHKTDMLQPSDTFRDIL